MRTKEDYSNYFEQIAREGRKMVYGTFELARLVEDPAVASVLKKIGDDEIRHHGYILKMLEVTIDARRPEHEQRREPRKRCLGMVRLRSIQEEGGREIEARCVNLSEHGICLECPENLQPGTPWELEIQLFDQEDILGRRGRIVWCKEVEADLYMCGIEFGP